MISAFRRVFGFALLACLAPLPVAAVAWLGNAAFGCTAHEGPTTPCVVAGVDIGDALFGTIFSGWLLLATLPMAAAIAVALGVAELIHLTRKRTAR